jgi:hypothetical protein
MTADSSEHRRRVELVIAVAVVVISLASLFTAVYQSIVMQRTLEASVWPRVEWENSNYDDERRIQEITFSIANRGVGPARIARTELLLDGERIQNVGALLQACCVDGATSEERASALQELIQRDDVSIFTSTVDGAALTPGQERTLVVFQRPPDQSPALRVWEHLNKARDELELSVCYCSVFDDCWITKARGYGQSTQPVRSCPTDEPGFTG